MSDPSDTQLKRGAYVQINDPESIFHECGGIITTPHAWMGTVRVKIEGVTYPFMPWQIKTAPERR